VEEVERAAKWAESKLKADAGKRFGDLNKAANKARRMATSAFEFDDEDDELNSSDYYLLLSAAGATEKIIQIYSHHRQVVHVPSGSAICWKARVKKNEIGFAVREQLKEGDTPTDIEPMSKYRSETLIQGQLSPVKYSRNIILVFENKPTSDLLMKTVAYWVSVGPNVSLEDDALGAARTKEVMAAEEGPPDE
jgi:hypothetical protein